MAITPEEMIMLENKLVEAKADTTPHVGVDGDEILVIGDANKTEKKVRDYKAVLRFPKHMAEHIAKEDIFNVKGDYVFVEVEFKDIWIKPYRDLSILTHSAEMFPFFQKVMEDGTTERYTEKELIAIATELGDDVIIQVYKVVGAILDIDDELCMKITWPSILDLIGKFITDFPEIFNETDFSSGHSAERA